MLSDAYLSFPLEAAQGGQFGYAGPGWHLGLHLAEMIEADDDEDRDARLEGLAQLLDECDPSE